MTAKPYDEDLAHIHDAGHGRFARAAAPVVLDLLRLAGLPSGLVVDLGCGSGILAAELSAGGYDVLGIDISPAMIELARRRAPRGRFEVGSLLAAQVPPCIAVTAVGECFNYLFDDSNTTDALGKLFGRVFAALPPGGLLIFDVAGPGRVPGGSQRSHREEDDWAVLVSTEEQGGLLTRRITSFRKVGELYRRGHEVHRLRLYPPPVVAELLNQAGFHVRALDGYGELRFGPGHAGFAAHRPG